ncbi:MAG TPA: hypothetical protein VHD33_01680 [Legionellaceae bacterium]|nr:hypothetical protein [Legionellaceae bacterium]
MSYNLLENSDTIVFWEIPRGKPNPAEPFPGIGMPDIRARIDAPGQKNETCTYYSFNFFRPRIGKHLDSDPQLRYIEQLFSQHRKKHTSFLNQKDREIRIANSILLQISGQSISEYSDISKEDKLQLLQKLHTESNSHVHYIEQIFNNHNKSMVSLNEELLRALTFDLSTFTQRFLHKVQLPLQSYHLLSIQMKHVVSSAAITFARLQHYPQLAISNWTIQDGPQSLMDEIRRFGPINARGYYGNHYYSEGALFSLKNPLCGHTIFAWKPNTRLEAPEDIAVPTHSVVVIGLIKNEANKFFVLFIDPRDESKLQCPRKIYQLSYDNFIKYMGNLYGLQTQYSATPGTDCMIRYTQDAGESCFNYGR